MNSDRRRRRAVITSKHITHTIIIIIIVVVGVVVTVIHRLEQPLVLGSVVARPWLFQTRHFRRFGYAASYSVKSYACPYRQQIVPRRSFVDGDKMSPSRATICRTARRHFVASVDETLETTTLLVVHS